MTTTIGSLDLNTLNDLYSDSNQYFWFESNASATYGAGAHVTLVPDTSFISNPTGQNILMNTDGFSIRNGLLPMMTLDNDSLDFNVVDTTAGTYTTTATFTAISAQIGQSSGAHSVIDANGQRFYASDGTTQLANIGYGEGQSQTGTAIAPYYTFGTRVSNSTIGNYSMAEGFSTTAMGANSHAEGQSTTASGYSSHAEGLSTTAMGASSHAEGNHTTASVANSHAEGDYTTASGIASHAEGNYTTASERWSHAEGDYTTASGMASHAEGNYTTASGNWSHAEGNYTTAKGTYSHAQNLFTVATENSQTVIGKYNAATVTGSGTDADPYVYSDVGDYAFIIGNGTDNTTAARSNAFTLDWNGNVDLPTGKFSGVGATLTYDASNSGTNALEINNASSNALTVDWAGNVDISGQYKISGAQIGSVMRLKGSSYSSPLGTSYKTLNLSTTAEINTGNAFTAASNGIKCAYAGTVHLIGKVRFNDGFTANDYMVAQIYNTTQSTAIQTGRMRTPTQVFNGDVWVNAYARVNANDVLLLRAENATGGRGTVTIGECSLTACYISA